MKNNLHSLTVLLVTLLSTASSTHVVVRAEESDVLSGADAKGVEMLTNYCYDCHVGDEPEGGIEVDFFEVGDSLERRVETVEKIIRVLKEQQMPPADYDQPSSTERVEVLQWIESKLASFDCGDVASVGRVTMRRLNRVEYNNSIRDLTGLALEPAKDFPSDDVGNGFDNIGDVLTIPPILLEKYLAAGSEIASAVVAEQAAFKRVFPFEAENPGDLQEVVDALIRSADDFMLRAFRRPPSSAESERMRELMTTAYVDKGLSPKKIHETMIAAVLSSPQFIYKVETASPSDYTNGVRQLNSYEMATRLSYFLWSSTPDERLLKLAERGELSSVEEIESAVDWMLDDPKSMALTENFAGQWLQLRDLAKLSPDPDLFPEYDGDLQRSMRRETELMFGSLVSEDRSVLDLLNADYSFLDGRLADFYGVDGVDGEEFQRVDLKGRRSGVLMHASVLLITSNPTRTSPVKRGKWVLDNLLGEPPPPPPPDVPELGESGETLGTLRQQMEQHRANPNCAVCHTKMDALGFGLENFDAIGRWRTSDGQGPIDPSGELPGGKQFLGPVDLVEILAENKKNEFTRCMSQKMLTYALGRGLAVYDRCTVNNIVARISADGFRFRTMVKAIATSEPFRFQEAAD
ncbi:MAG: DUF1592 domain-containing protein [Aureliella sp.]